MRFMADKPSDLVHGTLDMLILKTLALEPMHGYGIAVRFEQMCKGVFRLNAGSLFVAFQRCNERDSSEGRVRWPLPACSRTFCLKSSRAIRQPSPQWRSC
jgi:hypothetical protein